MRTFQKFFPAVDADVDAKHKSETFNLFNLRRKSEKRERSSGRERERERKRPSWLREE